MDVNLTMMIIVVAVIMLVVVVVVVFVVVGLLWKWLVWCCVLRRWCSLLW